MAEKPQNPASEMEKLVQGDAQEVEGATAVSEPVREEQVQNAIKFLSHPRVRGSPVIHRRSFLEKKGLTKEEIDEAFRRVPDPPSNVTSVEAVASNQANLAKTTGSLPPQVSNQILERVSTPTTGVSIAPHLQQPKFGSSQALLAIGVVAASAVGTVAVFKKAIVPWLKTWIRKVAAEDNETTINKKPKVSLDEAAEAAKTAASAADVVAKASQELLNAKKEEKKYFETFVGMLDVQVKEMKSMSNAIHNLERTSAMETIFSADKQNIDYIQSKSWNGTTNNPVRTTYVNQLNPSFSSSSTKHTKANGSEDMGRSSSISSTTSATEPPHPKSYMEIIEMIQRGEKPPNIKDIDDTPPNPDQSITKPRLAPRPKPWELSQQTQLGPPHGLPSHTSNSVDPMQTTSHQINGHSDSFESSRKNVVNTDEINHEAVNSEQFPQEIRNSERSSNQHWIAPQLPSPWMSEAASAMRQSTSSIEKQMGAEKLITSSNEENRQVGTSDSAMARMQDQPAIAIDS